MGNFSSAIAPAAVYFALLLLLSSTRILVSSKRYDLSPGWRAFNNGSLKGASDAGGSSYRILRAGNDPIVSDNGNFSLAFHDPSGTRRYFLSVILNPGTTKPTPPALVVPIWTANSNSSLSENATLMLTATHGKFILLDSSPGADLRWSSGTVVDIAGVELQDTGNLIFYDKEANALWQSFQHPTNVVVPGQKLRRGMSISSVSSSSSQSGQFRGTMEPSGFVFYVLPETEVTMADMLRQPQPYHVWSIGGDTLESALKVCDSSNATMAVSSSGIQISYEESNSCGASIQAYRSEISPLATQYWKIEDNGDFVLREFGDTEQNWAIVFHLSDSAKDSCKLPTACGSYGLCNSRGRCQCVQNLELDDRLSSKPCSRPSDVSVSCLANEAVNHHFVKIPGATYFSAAFSAPDLEVATLDDCSSACASNCSCAAAVYRSSSRACFLVDEMMGSLSLDPARPDATALVKIQNAKLVAGPLATSARRTSKSARAVIVFLAVLCFVFAAMLALGVYVVKTRYPHAYNKMMRRK